MLQIGDLNWSKNERTTFKVIFGCMKRTQLNETFDFSKYDFKSFIQNHFIPFVSATEATHLH